MDSVWSAVVEECLEEAIARYPNRPIPGAPFSQILRRLASAKGLDFPPPPFRSFRTFIKTFNLILIVQERPGRDILIAPAHRADLLSGDSTEAIAHIIRADMFSALTQISNRSNAEPFYSLEADQIVWVEPDQTCPNGAIPFVKATFDQEILDRRAFIDSQQEFISSDAATVLSNALQSTSPLGAFSNAIKSFELGNSWHRYRMGVMLKRLQRWSSEHGIEWKSSWIVESGGKAKDLPIAEQAPPILAEKSTSAFGRDFFTALATVLSDEDLARITVPLDLVAKIWNNQTP